MCKGFDEGIPVFQAETDTTIGAATMIAEDLQGQAH
jgi:hypothetical protein